KQRQVALERLDIVPGGDRLRLRLAGIGDADQFHLGQAGQNAGMLLAQMPDPDHRHAQTCHVVVLCILFDTPYGARAVAERRPIPCWRSISASCSSRNVREQAICERKMPGSMSAVYDCGTMGERAP